MNLELAVGSPDHDLGCQYLAIYLVYCMGRQLGWLCLLAVLTDPPLIHSTCDIAGYVQIISQNQPVQPVALNAYVCYCNDSYGRGYYHQKTGVTKSHRSDITTGGGINNHRSDTATGSGTNSHGSDICH